MVWRIAFERYQNQVDLRHKTIACFSWTIWNWHDPARFVEQVQMKFYKTARSKYQLFAAMFFPPKHSISRVKPGIN